MFSIVLEREQTNGLALEIEAKQKCYNLEEQSLIMICAVVGLITHRQVRIVGIRHRIKAELDLAHSAFNVAHALHQLNVEHATFCDHRLAAAKGR